MVPHMAWRTNTGGEKKTITRVCLWSTWAHHSDCPRDKTSFINVIWKRHEFISPWGKKLQFWFQFFRVKSSLCPLWRKWRPSISTTPFTSLLPLNYVANPLPSFPTVAPCVGRNCWGERGKAMTPQEGSCCVHLTPAQLTSTHFPLPSLTSEHQ